MVSMEMSSPVDSNISYQTVDRSFLEKVTTSLVAFASILEKLLTSKVAAGTK